MITGENGVPLQHHAESGSIYGERLEAYSVTPSVTRVPATEFTASDSQYPAQPTILP